MERTLRLIQRAHEGDKEARGHTGGRECRACLEYRSPISKQRCGIGRSVSDRNHRAD